MKGPITGQFNRWQNDQRSYLKWFKITIFSYQIEISGGFAHMIVKCSNKAHNAFPHDMDSIFNL